MPDTFCYLINKKAKTKVSGYSRRPTSANKLETYAVTEVESEHFRDMSNGRTDNRGRFLKVPRLLLRDWQ